MCLLPLLLYLFYLDGVSIIRVANCDFELLSVFLKGEAGEPCSGDEGSRGTTFKTLRRRIFTTDLVDRIKDILLSGGYLCC